MRPTGFEPVTSGFVDRETVASQRGLQTRCDRNETYGPDDQPSYSPAGPIWTATHSATSSTRETSASRSSDSESSSSS